MQSSSPVPDPKRTADDDRHRSDTIEMDNLSIGEAFSALRRLFQYGPGLPESLRHVGSYATELIRESANWLVPAAFRNSQSYSSFARQVLEHVARNTGVDLGQQEKTDSQQSDQLPNGESEDERVFLARKTVSSLLDMAALATFHVSPLTVMAVFSEEAYQWNGHIQQLGVRLKEQHILPIHTRIDSASQLVSAIENAIGSAPAIFENPLISIKGINKTIVETRMVVARTDASKLLPLAEIDQLQRQMELAADWEKASIWDVSATISVVALNHIQAAENSSLVTLDIPGSIFQHHIIDHYWEGLRAIERNGLLTTLSQASQPFLETLWTNYAMDQKTWTEQLLSGELLKWGWSQLSWPKLTRSS